MLLEIVQRLVYQCLKGIPNNLKSSNLIKQLLNLRRFQTHFFTQNKIKMKKILLIGLTIAVIGIGIGLMMYNKPHENMANAKVDASIEAPALFSAFSTDEAAANEKYLNKTVAVTGTVSETKNENGAVSVMLASDDLMFGVKCELDALSEHKRKEFQSGEKVTFKCICTGYLSDVVLTRCVEQ
jgi:hypothetical protein